MNIIREFCRFSASDAARATGVTAALQRDWRRRSYLPSLGGKHARFDAFVLSQLALARALSNRSIGPAKAQEIVSRAAPTIVWNALINFPNLINVSGPKKYIERYSRRLEGSGDEFLKLAGISEGLDVRFLVEFEDYLVMTAELDAVFKRSDSVVSFVIDLESIARSLAASIDGHLVTVRLE